MMTVEFCLQLSCGRRLVSAGAEGAAKMTACFPTWVSAPLGPFNTTYRLSH